MPTTELFKRCNLPTSHAAESSVIYLHAVCRIHNASLFVVCKSYSLSLLSLRTVMVEPITPPQETWKRLYMLHTLSNSSLDAEHTKKGALC
jgi:hypothetical protein